jgi:aminoglycoside N3'-acetyltransferase
MAERKEVGRAQLAGDLAALGLRAGHTVMMHSSLSALGQVDGGADTVVDALLDVVGPAGTLLVPAFRDSVWGDLKHFTNSDCDCSSSDRLCPSQQPGFQGAIAEAVRRRPGSLRSCHPTHSWAALGPAARQLLVGHRDALTFCGPGNPFEELLALDGCLLTLGVRVNTITLWHYYEEVLLVPYLGNYWPKERHMNHCVAGRRIQYDYPGIMQDVCLASGILKAGPTGKGVSGLTPARLFDSFMSTIVADDPYCFVVRPPSRDCGDLALDALAKGAAMLRAWAHGPRRPQHVFGIAPRSIDAAGPGDPVRRDCPAYAGEHPADGRPIPLCRANGIHPKYFRQGGPFGVYGMTTCGLCSWNEKFAPAGER